MTNFTHSSRVYLLDVNSYWSELTADVANGIYNRRIDTDAGKFINITAVREGDLFARTEIITRSEVYRFWHKLRNENFPSSKSNPADERIRGPIRKESFIENRDDARWLVPSFVVSHIVRSGVSDQQDPKAASGLV